MDATWSVPSAASVAAILLASVCAVRAVAGDSSALVARIDAQVTTIPPGQPVFVDLTLRNASDQPLILSVPGVESMPPAAVAELPLAHVFSGIGFQGPIIRSDSGREWTDVFGYHQPASTPELILGPQAIVGTRVRLDQYYPALRSPGDYRIVWQPYGGHVESNQLLLRVATFKQAKITTDVGELTIQFDYTRAPDHVANFIELAKQGFYNQKTFHRIVPGYFIQGGCPNGDGSGIRFDGKKLKAEFSNHQFSRGTVSMARLESDPDSASCQFIICNTRLPEWDGRYTAFGELVGEESFRTLEQLMTTEVDPDDVRGRPLRSLVIRMVRIEDSPDQVSPMAPAPTLAAPMAPVAPSTVMPTTPATPAPLISRQPQEIRPMRPTE